MNIDEMTDQEKSVMLARIMPGWEFSRQECGEGRWSWVDENGEQISGSLHDDVVQMSDDPWWLVAPMLYSPPRMALAWRVLNWAWNYPMADDDAYQFVAKLRIKFGMLFGMPPADAQRAWLDKILELAIEAGLIQEVE